MPFIDYIVQSASKFTVYRFVGELCIDLILDIDRCTS